MAVVLAEPGLCINPTTRAAARSRARRAAAPALRPRPWPLVQRAGQGLANLIKKAKQP